MAKCYGEAKLKTDRKNSISALNLNNGEEEWLYDDGDTLFMVASPELMDYAMYNYILLDHRNNLVYAVQSADLDFDIEGVEDDCND